MAATTGIAWTDSTWNPVRGCSRVSEGCRFCFAEKIAARFSGPGQPFAGYADRKRTGSKWTGHVEAIWPLLDLPLRWRKPRRIFVNSMSDLFHEALPADEIATIYAVMVAAVHLRGHTLQVLTKRPDRMRKLLTSLVFWEQVNAEAGVHVMEGCDPLDRRRDDARATCDDYGPDKPPPGIWLGASVENQDAYDHRSQDLCNTPAAVRFLSCEPLLGPINLHSRRCRGIGSAVHCPACFGGIDWVIVGGESGRDSRPMRPDWARSLRDQCAADKVPFFFKQVGSLHHGWGAITGKGHDPAQWPEDLRVQEFPA